MTFSDWIDSYGIKKLAKKLKLEPATIRYWKRGQTPSAQQMRRIRKLSKGKIGYEQMIDNAQENLRQVR